MMSNWHRQLINVSQYYLFSWTCLLHLIQLTIMYFSLDWKTSSVYQVKYLNGFHSIWNNALRECLFKVFYLAFSLCYLVYHRVQFLVLWFSQCIPVLLGSVRSDMGVNITCMLMTHSYIYLYIYIYIYIFVSWLWFKFIFFHCIADIRLWMTQNLLRLNDNKTNILYLASPHCIKSLKHQHYRWMSLRLTLMGQQKTRG